MSRKCNVLFLCRANSARSIMGEALLRQLGADRFEAFSAGVEPADDVHPLTLAQLRPTMGELGKMRPRSWDIYTNPQAPVMDVVIAMCEQASESHAPRFPGNPIFCEWNFADPLAASESPAEQKRIFEQVFRQILRRVSVFVALPLHSMKAAEQRSVVNAIDDHAPPSLISH